MKGKLMRIMDFVLLVCFIILVFPPVEWIGEPTVLYLICVALWMVSSMVYFPGFYLHIKLHRLFALVFYLATSLVPYMLGATTVAHRYMATPIIPLGFFIYEYYKESGRLESLQRIIEVALCFAILTGIITYYNLLDNSWVSRTIKSSGEYSESLGKRGIGGYSYIYFLVTASVILLHGTIHSRRLGARIIYASLFVLSVFIALKANYLTALAIELISMTVYFLAVNLKKGKRKALKVIVAFSVIWLVIVFSDKILELLGGVLPARVGRVLNNSLHTNVVQSICNEFIQDRLPTLMSSIEAFIESPIFGLIASNADLSGDFLTGFGQHSYVLDTFALYGFLLGMLNIYVLLLAFRKTKCTRENLPLMWSAFIAMVIMAIANNMTDSIALSFGILFPCIVEEVNVKSASMDCALAGSVK